MGTRDRRGRAPIVGLLPLLTLLLACAIAACGDSDTAPTDLPTRTTPVAAYSFPAQEPFDTGEYCSETDGLEFVPWVDIEVTSLGYYDDGDDGLVQEHTVGIFETSSKELVTARRHGRRRERPAGRLPLRGGRPGHLDRGLVLRAGGQHDCPLRPLCPEARRPRLGA